MKQQVQSDAVFDLLSRKVRIRKRGNKALYRQISTQMKSLVQQGELAPGQRVPAHSVLAKRLDIHPMTVERAYSDLQQQGVLTRQRGRGSFVNSPDKIVPAKATVLLPDWAEIHRGPHMAFQNTQFLAGAEEYLRSVNVSLEIMTFSAALADLDPDGWVARIREQHHGLLCRLSTQQPIVEQLAKQHFPVVTCFYRISDQEISSVMYDRESALFMATSHLLELGRRRISFLGSRPGTLEDNTKFNGYLKALEAHDVPYYPSSLMRASGYDNNSRREAVERAIAEKRLGDAIVVDGVDAGPIAMEVLRAHGIKVPDDVAIVGNDEPHAGGKTDPPLTWVYVPRYEVGREAAQVLAEQIKNPDIIKKPVHRCLRARLVLGRSCGHPQGGDGLIELSGGDSADFE